MDYKKLAELLYPKAKSVDFFFDIYKKRVLSTGAEVTRLAPSPTGYLHIGHASQALACKLTAKKSGGVFFVRLEDTDQKREIEGAGKIALEMLNFFELGPDEGYLGDTETGEYGPYIQSKRLEIYQAFAKHLVSLGRAFPCFCEKRDNKEDILKDREQQIEEGAIETKDPCRDLTLKQIEEKLEQNKSFALRLCSEGDGVKTFKFKDLIKGEREIVANDKDIVLIKGNGTPVYALAHVVDDTLMGTTTVIRGEEWYSSLSGHLELFKAFGFVPPKYAHTPVICKTDAGNKRKLSKRKDPEADMRYFIKSGYPKTAVIEYLLNLANSDFELWRAKNPDADYSEFLFAISKIGSNNPMFDFDKLNNISKEIISKLPAQQIYEDLLTYTKEYDTNFYDIIKNKKDYCLGLFNIDRGGVKPRKDIANLGEIKNLYSYMFKEFYNPNKIDNYDFDPKISKADIKCILLMYRQTIDMNDDKQSWFEKIKALCEPFGFAVDTKSFKQNPQNFKGSVADVSGIIRVAITGRRNTPDLYEIIKLLGKREVTERIGRVLELLKVEEGKFIDKIEIVDIHP
ncbi:MAG: glutamate--tRNA ligase [Christensenellaceae bacterium]|jgi:glutamyl-tRNA synthetase|nr:glutamate--tRNA ligase [Christensenellaceae bacterium]